MSDAYTPNNVAKSILHKLYKDKSEETDIIVRLCRLLSHTYIKMQAYAIMIQSLESMSIRYRMKENEVNKSNTIFTVIAEPMKLRIVELEISGNEVFCTAYTQLCIASFIPLIPHTRIMLREIGDLIKSTIKTQEAYISMLRSN